jgi:integrase
MSLNALRVKNAKPGDRLSDGNGLRLDVDQHGNASWVLRYRSPVHGKERYMGLGSRDHVSLSDARAATLEARRAIQQGNDPLDLRKAQRTEAKVEASKAITFETYALSYIAAHEAGWKNPKHRQQWTNSLKTYAFPIIGQKPVSAIEAGDVRDVLSPIWVNKTETASRVRGRIEIVLSAATAEGLRTGPNPARWKDNIKLLLAKRENVGAVVHHPALPYAELPEFMRSLSVEVSASSLLLQFIILTAVRFNEAARASRGELNLNEKTWTVPSVRMKGDLNRPPHVVPLSEATLAVLASAATLFGDAGLIFPGRDIRVRKPLSDVALAKAIARHTKTKATTHGFRSTFRDWAGDETSHSGDVIELALAHIIEDETEAAYRRSTALKKRGQLMDDWAAYAMKVQGAKN